MSTADLAAVVFAAEVPLLTVAMAIVITNHRERMATVDRVRIVNPSKQPEIPAQTATGERRDDH